ncbi:MAG: transglutaminase-like domain-containing protein [Proteobacteria bacterium]|nr:transglutaminase-like domain-containing protein [Pseudomonadota bacterium]
MNFSILIRIAFLSCWLIVFGLLLERDYFVKTIEVRETEILKRGREESFMGIYFQGERIGYVKNRLYKTDNQTVALEQNAYMRLNILNESHPISMDVKAELTDSFLLKHFDFKLSSPFYQMQAQGEVIGNDVHFTLLTGKEEIKDIIRLKKPPFISTNQRAYLLKEGLKEGEKIKIPYFDPISLSGKDTIMEYRGYEKKLIKGRVYKLHHFIETFSGVRINSWIDDNGKVIQEESPAGFVFISEPEFKATDIALKGKEILSAVSAPIIGRMPDITKLNAIQYRLSYPEGAEVELDTDRQQLAGDMLTVTIESLPAINSLPCSGYDNELASTPYIQSLNQAITDQVSDLVDENDPPLATARIISEWVYNNLEKRPVLGIPDALTTLSIKKGDCNEHAALFAAMARNAKIPTRIVAGVVYYDDAFYYHAWNEVCLDDRWISLDTTKNQFPADISHIKFISGETKEMIKIGALLGKLTIEVMGTEDSLEQGKHPN